MNRMFRHSRTYEIEWGDCDPAGIVFYPRYFAIFDASTALLLEAALGKKKSAWIKEFGIAGIPMVDTGANFRRPCSYGDVVSIESAISEIGRTSFGLSHLLTNKGEVAVEAHEKRVWTGRDENGALRAMPLPEEVVARLRAG